MADPRKTLAYNRIGTLDVTYKIDGSTITFDATKDGGSAAVGKAVMVSGNDTVALTSDGAPVKGKLILVERDGCCTIQVDGYCDLPGGLAATLTPGLKIVGATGAGAARGYIRAIAPATLADVAAGRGEIINSSDPTKTVVEL